MKVETKKIDSTKREIYIEVDSEIVKKKFEEVFSQINKEAKVPGFRTGHIPLNILEKHFSKEANQRVIQELIPEVYQQVINQNDLEVVDYPDIYDIKLDRNSLSFRAKVEVLPQINLKNYRRIKLHYKKIEVTEEELNNYINSLLKQRNLEKLDENFAHSLGYPDIESLKDSLSKQLFIQKENQLHKRIQSEIVDYLLKEADFKVPSSLVERKLEELLKAQTLELALQGFSNEEIEKRRADLSKELRPYAEKQARLQIILTQIAKQENIPLDDNTFIRVWEFLYREAEWHIST